MNAIETVKRTKTGKGIAALVEKEMNGIDDPSKKTGFVIDNGVHLNLRAAKKQILEEKKNRCQREEL